MTDGTAQFPAQFAADGLGGVLEVRGDERGRQHEQLRLRVDQVSVEVGGRHPRNLRTGSGTRQAERVPHPRLRGALSLCGRVPGRQWGAS